MAAPLDLVTNQMISFSTLTEDLITHAPNLIKHLPASTEKQLSNNSFDKKIFQESAIYYEDT